MKDLNSKWEPSDRSGKWQKLKPEYIRAGSDLDVLIIGTCCNLMLSTDFASNFDTQDYCLVLAGGYYGSGRHGGEVRILIYFSATYSIFT